METGALLCPPFDHFPAVPEADECELKALVVCQTQKSHESRLVKTLSLKFGEDSKRAACGSLRGFNFSGVELNNVKFQGSQRPPTENFKMREKRLQIRLPGSGLIHFSQLCFHIDIL